MFLKLQSQISFNAVAASIPFILNIPSKLKFLSPSLQHNYILYSFEDILILFQDFQLCPRSHFKVCILKPLQRNGWFIFNEKQSYLFTKL